MLYVTSGHAPIQMHPGHPIYLPCYLLILVRELIYTHGKRNYFVMDEATTFNRFFPLGGLRGGNTYGHIGWNMLQKTTCDLLCRNLFHFICYYSLKTCTICLGWRGDSCKVASESWWEFKRPSQVHILQRSKFNFHGLKFERYLLL